MRTLNYKHFRIGLLLAGILASTLFAISISYGKERFFLLLNGDLGSYADLFFTFGSFIAEWFAWVIVFAYFIFSGNKRFLPLLISCLLLTTFIAQFFKYIIVPDALRPSAVIKDHIFHSVKNVILYTSASFPSGHTATAFTIYLLMCLVVKNRLWIFFGLLYAILVGYSRIYLAEHFPFDVAGGITTAIISVTFSVLIWQIFRQRKTQ